MLFSLRSFFSSVETVTLFVSSFRLREVGEVNRKCRKGFWNSESYINNLIIIKFYRRARSSRSDNLEHHGFVPRARGFGKHTVEKHLIL